MSNVSFNLKVFTMIVDKLSPGPGKLVTRVMGLVGHSDNAGYLLVLVHRTNLDNSRGIGLLCLQ